MTLNRQLQIVNEAITYVEASVIQALDKPVSAINVLEILQAGELMPEIHQKLQDLQQAISEEISHSANEDEVTDV